MSDRSPSVRSRFGWLIRISAWLILAVMCLRPLLAPGARVDGAMLRTRILGDHRAAGDQLLTVLNLRERFPPELYGVKAGYPRDLLPATWLWIQKRARDDPFRAHWLWIDESRAPVLPPLTIVPRPAGGHSTIPEAFHVTASNGAAVLAAWFWRFDPSGTREWMIWLHRDGSWINVVRFEGPLNVSDMFPQPNAVRTECIELDSPPVLRIPWTAIAQEFVMPTLPAGFRPLPSLPPQSD